MELIKNIIKRITPRILINKIKKYQKAQRANKVFSQKNSNNILYKKNIVEGLIKMGIKPGMNLLVHTSMSKIGYIEGGPETVINALIEVLDCPNKGTLLMPTFPNKIIAKDYFKTNKSFDVLKTPSAMGKITELFRNMEGVKRSFHPSHPIATFGLNTDFLISEHYNQLTPFNEKSPFFKLGLIDGKILLIGLKMGQSLTNLHVLEDMVENFKFPVYDQSSIEIEMINEDGLISKMKTKYHKPKYSSKRRCDDLERLFLTKNVLKKTKLGNADCILLDAKKLHKVMFDEYKLRGVTMYTPYGSK